MTQDTPSQLVRAEWLTACLFAGPAFDFSLPPNPTTREWLACSHASRPLPRYARVPSLVALCLVACPMRRYVRYVRVGVVGNPRLGTSLAAAPVQAMQ